MKVLIWFLCIFNYSVITTIIKENGIILGAIPTVIFLGGTIWLARTLCKLWDKIKENKKIKKKETAKETQPIDAENEDTIRYCRICGEKLLDGSCFCRKCGTEIVKE